MSRDKAYSIKNWPKEERPRERLIRHGSEQLSDAQLLGILIGSGDRQSNKNAIELSLDLLKFFEVHQPILLDILLMMRLLHLPCILFFEKLPF